jgi:hypothetical protein
MLRPKQAALAKIRDKYDDVGVDDDDDGASLLMTLNVR